MNTPRISPKASALAEKAKGLIPGLSQLLSKRPDQFAPGSWPVYYSRAKGCQVWDLDGRSYLDMGVSAVGATVLGYADDEVNQAVTRAVELGSNCSLNCPEEVELAERLCQLHPWAQAVRYARTGGEAMAVAVRIARAHTGRDIVAFCGYHGWHDWYLAANLHQQDALEGHLLKGLSPKGVPKGLTGTALTFRYNHPEELEAIVARHGDKLAAVIMEPVRNYWPLDGFLQKARDLARQAGAVFVFDEISAGFRLTTGGAHLALGVEPDMAVLGKALGNGFAIAAIMGRAAVMDAVHETFISSLNWTERIGPCAALCVLRKHQRENVGEHLVAIGQQVQRGWARIAQDRGVTLAISGIAPMSHFSFAEDDPLLWKSVFVQMMLERGYLTNTYFYPMLAHRPAQVDDYLAAMDQVVAEMKALHEAGRLGQALVGPAASSGFTRLT